MLRPYPEFLKITAFTFLLSLVLMSTYSFAGEPAQKILEAAEQAYVGQDFSKALESYDKFLKTYPHYPDVPLALYWKGRALLAMDRFVEAQEAFLKAGQQTQDLFLQEKARLGYADSLFYVGELEGAFLEYEKLLEVTLPADESYLLCQMGSIWKSRGNREKAWSFFQNIQKNYPESYEASLVKNEVPPMGQESQLKTDQKIGSYFIQVGVFKEKVHIERLLQKLKDLGYPYEVEGIEGVPQKSYKIKVGPFKSKMEGRKNLFELQQKSSIKGHLIQE